MKILIIDYGMGNINSIYKKIVKLNCEVIVSNKFQNIHNADKIILPGVGHFKKAMKNLHDLHLIETLNEAVLEKRKPILGICLGMQLMAKYSEEGNENGLGWIDAKVVRFKVTDTKKYKVPHMGWNQIDILNPNILMKYIENNTEFYFVHSYHLLCNNIQDVLNITEYCYKFVSAIAHENIFGVQYHPEKSHDSGTQLLNNFINV